MPPTIFQSGLNTSKGALLSLLKGSEASKLYLDRGCLQGRAHTTLAMVLIRLRSKQSKEKCQIKSDAPKLRQDV